ncbi:MAG: hypothetical protein JWO73_328 [Candidatus Taylorbacteria bacterium]|nr:hypothetical protein [Candidatus Taylorbacteria bacterium]
MIYFILSFVGGILTVLAPCVLPLLPVIVGGSISNGANDKGQAGTQPADRKRALIITISLGISVMLFTFILKVSTLFIMIPQSVWTWISGGIIVIFGAITLFPSLWEKVKFMSKLNRSSNKAMGAGYMRKSVLGDIIIGASLGPVFSTCSPTYFVVLATVLPMSPLAGFIDLLAYTAGLCGALLIISLVGQKVMAKLDIAADPKGWFKKTLGIIFIIVGFMILGGADKKLEAWLLTSGFFDVTKIEQSLLRSADQTDMPIPPSTTDVIMGTSTESSAGQASFLSAAEKAVRFKKSPEIVGASGFINTKGLGANPADDHASITVAQFKGKKVVLLDIWTYSCINCQRTLPYVESWYDKYADTGLEIISIHTPEFSFEKVQKNVEDAAKRLGVKYPIVLDNDYSTWNALHNQYWPRKYLVDIDGYIVYDHIGEGNYDETEKAIQKALIELHGRNGETMPMPAVTSFSTPAAGSMKPVSYDGARVGSPEVYFGAGRNEYLANGRQGMSGDQSLVAPDASKAQKNALYLGGTWSFESEFAEEKSASAAAPATVLFRYNAKNVYMVASADKAIAPNGVEIEVYKDGVKQCGVSGAGNFCSANSSAPSVIINAEQLYQLIEGDSYGEHTLEIRIKKGGLKAFTFTFG